MNTADKLEIGFKEWAVVCDEVLAGRQIVLLRKGGILEQKQGFQVEHNAFLLYPNTEHQSSEQLKPELHARLASYPPPAKVSGFILIPGFCQVVDIIKTTDPEKLRALEPLTCWTQALFDMRIRYKPEKPNFVLTIRAYKLPEPLRIPYDDTYAGCHTWVPLKQAVSIAGAQPVLSEDQFEACRREALRVVG